RFADSYAEISPSGKGVKIWTRAQLPSDSGVAFPLGDGRIEVYDHARYFTVTGKHWGCQFRDIEEHQADVEWLLSLSTNGNHKVPYKTEAKIPKGQQHDTLVSMAGSMRARGADPEAILAALNVINEKQCSEPGPAENIRKIAESTRNWERGTPSARQVVNGHADPPLALPSIDPHDALTLSESLLATLLSSGEAHLIYGTPEGPPAYLTALAAAGSVAQQRAKASLKAKFPKEFVAGRWNTELK